MEKFDVQDIYTAYRRFKNNCYYDNSNLFLRLEIAKFEEQFEFESENPKDELVRVFQPITDFINSAYDYYELHKDLSGFSQIEFYLAGVTCCVFPKETNQKGLNKKGHFMTNKIPNGPIEVKSCNYMINAPIAIHIMSVLWVENVGVKLSSLISNNNYAYRLNTSSDENQEETIPLGSLALFQPYFIGYRQWRDNALEEANRLLDNGHDVTLLSLDIKRYYYSVRLNVPLLVESLLTSKENFEDIEKIRFLDVLLQCIHDDYQKKIGPYIDNATTAGNFRGTVLPVGLLSSGILANLYLVQFDKYIARKVSPSYYGRYVDDMLFVFKDKLIVDDNELLNPVDEFIKDYFCSVGALVEDDTQTIGKEKTYFVNIIGKQPNEKFQIGNLRIQSEKVVMEHFEHQGSRAAIDLFMHNLSKNRSEYRFLPEEENITAEFDDEAYQLLYDGSIHKFRSVQDFKEDKYGAVKYLANQILLSRLADFDKTFDEICQKKKVAHQLLTFFMGAIAVSMYTLWERVTTYFVLNDDYSSLVKFYKNIMQVIDNLHVESGLDKKQLQADLYHHLMLSIAMPLALKSSRVEDKLKDKLKNEDLLFGVVRSIRQSNMFRINNVRHLGIHLTNALLDNEISLVSDNLSSIYELKECEVICFLSPKDVTFEEINMLAVYQAIHCRGFDEKVYKGIDSSYRKYGKGWPTLLRKTGVELKNEVEILQIKNDTISVHEQDSKEHLVDKKIAIVNKKVFDEHFMNVVKYGIPLHTPSRRQELIKIFNEAVEQKCDMLVMPELSVPFAWLGFLAERAKKNNMAIVAGLEYCVYIDNDDDDEKNIKNYVATILPFCENTIKGSFVHLREKNFYSPKEELMLDGYRYHFQKQVKNPHYDLFHWRKSYFSVYNCFELADIQSRSKFMSKVDFIVAVEFNKDIHYFSDVVSSWARDIHCFIVQVNSSHFGDSKIIMPSKTDEKMLVQVKGGENTVVLVCRLPISALRDFQLANYSVQLGDKRFKFTPPGFDHNMALKRHNDEDVY